MGRPVTDERGLLERFCLEGFSVRPLLVTILRKRENFRAAFACFDPEHVARFGKRDVERLLLDAGIVRQPRQDRGSDRQCPRHASRWREAGTPLVELVWGHHPRKIRAAPKGLRDLPATTPESNALRRS